MRVALEVAKKGEKTEPGLGNAILRSLPKVSHKSQHHHERDRLPKYVQLRLLHSLLLPVTKTTPIKDWLVNNSNFLTYL
ncbi:hypothetical protein CK510_25735 [Brunnivagina elsteri CCALA 953]|uniref:Uncharacterized protein n=2 Tax=Brunnivagina TaxID=3344733 RepID=A0A2A2TC93_9CYAN|nr:hypothetical protein CK510_25735 [Calothrix elsteri CCALA 953]